jgi:hypothetical protein
MEQNREKELVKLLNEYDVAGVPFVKAKQEILAKGFTEAELVYGLYSAPFDGKVNGPRSANPLEKFYQENPEKADKLAKALLLPQAEGDWNKDAAYTAASEFGPDIQSRSYYGVRAADKLGIPYFALMFFGIILFIVAIRLNLSKQTTDTIFLFYSISVSSIFGYKLLQERRRVKRSRKELQVHKN